ncbi:hypothetical protein D3R35_26020 [Salmonella enterica]|nr:hypothetical protein [Salmonella enterica]EBN9650351.1 hypothetical protein [Salmonella enterica]
MKITHKIPVRRWLLPGLLGLALCSPVSTTYAATIETGFSPEGTALQLVLGGTAEFGKNRTLS